MLQCWNRLGFADEGLCVESNYADFIILVIEHLYSSAVTSVSWLPKELFLITEQSGSKLGIPKLQ